jgi:GTPase SAR1 family protein
MRWLRDRFDPEIRPTVGVAVQAQIPITDLDKNFHMTITDISGQASDSTVTSLLGTVPAAAMIVYDVTDPASFAAIPTWIRRLRQWCGKEIPFLLVGNKTDLGTNITEQQINSFTDQYQNLRHFIATAAINDGSTDSAFNSLVDLADAPVIPKFVLKEAPPLEMVQPDSQTDKASKCCLIL